MARRTGLWRWRGLVVCGALTVLGATPAVATDPIEFQTPGAADDLARALRAASVLLGAERDERTDPQDLVAAARAEYGALLATLYANAHYAPVITVTLDGREAASLAPLDAPGRIGRIVVTVNAGPRFAFSRAEITPLAPETDLPAGFAIGKPAETGVIRDAAKSAIEGWRAVGHAKAEVGAQDLAVEHARQTLAARIGMVPGPRLRFGQFTVQGQTRMREDRIRAIAGFPEGEVFDPEQLEKSANRLRRSGVFRSVALTEADVPGRDGTLDVQTLLVEEVPRRFGFGAEISSLDGLDASAFWLHRNLFGGAERLRFDASIEHIGAQDSGVDYRFDVTLERPATFTPDTLLSLRAGIARLDNDEGEIIDLAEIGASVTQFVTDRLTLRGGFAFRAQDVSDPSGEYEYRNLALPLRVTMDARDDKFDATRGYFLNADVTPFFGVDDTDSGVRLAVDARGYQAFGSTLVLAGRLQVGAIYGAALERTPRDYLFYSGGAGTVRGHAFESLGVNVLDPDLTTGGSRFVAFTTELRARVTDRIGIVGFYDIGSVGVDDFIGDDAGGWQAGAGIGLRYATGLGPIRVDLATPISGEDSGGVQIYVGIGQSF